MPLDKTSPFRDAYAAVAAAAVAVVLWLVLRAGGPLKPEALFGWLCLFLILMTVVTIAQTAFAATERSAFRGFLFLSVTSLLLIGACALAGGHLGMREIVCVAAIFVTWQCLWAVATRWLCRLGSAAANAIALTVAALLMASPVVCIPLVRAAGVSGQGRLVELIRDTCPLLALVDAVRPSMKIDWSHLPGMYEWSGLGQDIPMMLPNAWVSVRIYAIVSCVLVAGTFLFGKVPRAAKA